MAAARRKDCDDIVNFMLFNDDSSSHESSSSDDELDLLLVDTLFPLKTSLHVFVPRMNIEDVSDEQCEMLFRFQKRDMQHLLTALEIPAQYICRQRTTASGMEALMILLRRLVYPNRLCDLVPLFGRSESELSLIFNEIVDDLHNRFSYLLNTLDLVWFEPEVFSQAIHNNGAPLQHCWGFIDGTPRPIARRIHSQRVMYSGHKQIHCIKFQSVQAPNGLIINMFGPIEGRRHDAFILSESGLTDKLRRVQRADGEPYVIYGDPAYGLTLNILSPFRGANLTAAEREFNALMSKVRVCVEWGFGKIIQNFAFLDFKKNLKILLQPVAKYYLVATLLTNCHTCLYGSLTSKFFNLDPPSLDTYLSNY